MHYQDSKVKCRDGFEASIFRAKAKSSDFEAKAKAKATETNCFRLVTRYFKTSYNCQNRKKWT